MKKILQKSTALLLTAAMMLGVGMTGCSGPSGAGASTGAGSGSNGNNDTSQKVDLTMYVVGDKPNQFDTVMQKFNEKLSKKLNAKLSVNWIGWGDYANKYPLLLSSGESFDLIYTATWLNFYQQAQKGAFMALDTLLPKYAPKSWEQTSAIARKEATVNGKIYCLPSGKSTYNAYGPIVRGDLMKKFNMTSITNFDDMEKYLENVKKYEPDMQPYDLFSQGSELDDLYMFTYGLYPLTGNCGSIYWIDPNAEHPKVIAKQDWEKMPEFLNKMKSWCNKGFWTKSALSNKDSLMTQNGKAAMKVHNIDTWSGLYIKDPKWDFQYFNIVKQNETLSYAQDAMAIPNSSKNPERALMLLELLRTDEDMYNAFTYGVEGVNYKKESDGTVKNLMLGDWTLDACGWGFRTDKFTRDATGSPPTLTQEKKKIQDTLKQNKYRAFHMDTDPIKNEYAAVQNVMQQYFNPLEVGYTDPVSGLAEVKKQMNAAGNEKIVTELQKQLDDFIAKNK